MSWQDILLVSPLSAPCWTVRKRKWLRLKTLGLDQGFKPTGDPYPSIPKLVRSIHWMCIWSWNFAVLPFWVILNFKCLKFSFGTCLFNSCRRRRFLRTNVWCEATGCPYCSGCLTEVHGLMNCYRFYQKYLAGAGNQWCNGDLCPETAKLSLRFQCCWVGWDFAGQSRRFPCRPCWLWWFCGLLNSQWSLLPLSDCCLLVDNASPTWSHTTCFTIAQFTLYTSLAGVLWHHI